MIRFWGWTRQVVLAGATMLPASLFVSAALADIKAEPPSWCAPNKIDAHAMGVARFQPVRDKLARGETITVIAVGSSSTEGTDLQDRQQSFPHLLVRRLNDKLGAERFRVLNKGRGGEIIADTVRRFDNDVVGERPDLVVWQLGANDIVRHVDPEAAGREVAHGFAKLATLNAPVVLMDSQLAPRVSASPTLAQTRRMIERAALEHGAILWSRFDLMQEILASGKASKQQLLKADDLHMTVDMHACAGIALGDLIGQQISPEFQNVRR
jgi:acyl-CoA thioesterase I